jgi:hypothetical protein
MMAMFNDLFELLADVPRTLVTAWAVWLGAGVLLATWFRRARLEPESQLSAPRPVSRPKSAIRQAASPDFAPAEMPLAETPGAAMTATDLPALERPRPARAVIGDPFGDLATLLDQPVTPVVLEPRPPADSPILNSSGSPIRRANGNDDANFVA